jgi:hypothetical protein
MENARRTDGSALDTLDSLTEAATAGIEGLIDVREQLEDVRRRKKKGWSWQEIMRTTEVPSPLTSLMAIVARLGSASAAFRRDIVHSLRLEGLRLTEIASLLGTSRQRVSALLRARRTE